MFEKSQEYLQICKNLVLDKYNMFEYVASICDKLNPNAPKEQVTIQPCNSSKSVHNLVNYLILRSYYKTEMKIYDIFH